jgi:hypothetical protein
VHSVEADDEIEKHLAALFQPSAVNKLPESIMDSTGRLLARPVWCEMPVTLSTAFRRCDRSEQWTDQQSDIPAESKLAFMARNGTVHRQGCSPFQTMSDKE